MSSLIFASFNECRDYQTPASAAFLDQLDAIDGWVVIIVGHEYPVLMADNQKLLDRYRQKRTADGTAEPFGGTVGTSDHRGALRFMVHHHAARNTHFDLRLEMEGVLRSWAVPKGPSPNQKDKRFAALVEDHPLEYGDFEGKIPDGNYGAGWTIVWDRGIWRPIEDPIAGLEKGKLLFELDGQKLHGKWTLVRMKTEKDWLFIKERDEFEDEDSGTDDYPMHSVFTGLSIDDLEDAADPVDDFYEVLGDRNPEALESHDIKPMLAKNSEPFSRDGWLFEIKYDGYRLICHKEGDQVTLLSRNGNDLSATFPEIVLAISRLPFESVVIDGEAVCHDASGMPSFARMQTRGRLTSTGAITKAAHDNPATLYAFDLLSFDELDLRPLPLTERKALLRTVIHQPGMIRFSDHIENDGAAMYHAAGQLGLEGVVGKKADSKYIAGRSDNWTKVRVDQTDDFVVMGYKGTTKDIRSLILGQYVDGELVYSGSAGSGLTATHSKQLRPLFDALDTLPRPKDGPDSKELIWKQPTLVCEVRFKEFTSAGQLRHPVFLRMRDDKDPEECTRQFQDRELSESVVEEDPIIRHVELSNLDKVFWPDEGYTKGDMIEYYDAVSPWLLPWLEDRPVVMTRYPDGIDGKSFYQKDAPDFVPDWLRIEKMWSDTTERDIGYFVVDCEEALVYLANMATIPLHIYHSRTELLEKPDWCVLDLDPKEAPFTDVITVAREIHELCEEIELPNFLKTSGSTGLHILLPLQNQFTFEQSRVLGELLARLIERRLPDICTTTRNPAKRDGKVYLDYLQNGSGKLIASPYCVRPKPGAPVSMPMKWSELTRKLTPTTYHIKNAIKRLKRMQDDPAIEVLDTEVDLIRVLESLTLSFQQETA
ncbi:MAG: DNA ligase D [Pseudomonadota bacterium]